VIGLPPVELGALQFKTTVWFNEVAESDCGTEGTDNGVTALDAVDAGPVPAAFMALTLNVYAVPFVSPVTDADVLVDVPSEKVEYVPPDAYSTR
jgi:hypothetical protein